MKYHSGDLIEQKCPRCDKKFLYHYPGRGRPYGHLCDTCFSIIHTHTRPGTILSIICKDCGKSFPYTSGKWRTLERCPSCRPLSIGSLVTRTCPSCKGEYSYIFKKAHMKLCPSCRTAKNKEYQTEWNRKSRGAVEIGTTLAATCIRCGAQFTYRLRGRHRKYCNNCLPVIEDMVSLERIAKTDETWNLNKWTATQRAFGYRCAYCGKRLKHFHRDHFIPKALGGPTDIGNIVSACPSCNLRKNAKHPAVFLSPEQYSNVVKVLDSLVRDYQFTGLLL